MSKIREKKAKRSQEPYRVSTLSIGEILKAKASSGDKGAIEFMKHCKM